MSDIEEAERILRLVLEVTGPDHGWPGGRTLTVRKEIEAYFRKPVCTIDANGGRVKFYIDPDGDVALEWFNPDMPDVYFEPGTLVDALRELGVIE